MLEMASALGYAAGARTGRLPRRGHSGPATVRPGRPDPCRVLLIDGEPMARAHIAGIASSARCAVDSAATGADGLRHADGARYDLVIVDLDRLGLAWRAVLVRLLARRPDQAVLVLSSVTDVATKVECLELGARDYLTKPFAAAELLARIRARLRDCAHARTGLMRAGDLTLDLRRLEADAGHGPVPLTRLEFLLLRELAEHAGHSVPTEQLLASVWGYPFDPGSNVVGVCVKRVRSKLGFGLIQTVRGDGYQLASC